MKLNNQYVNYRTAELILSAIQTDIDAHAAHFARMDQIKEEMKDYVYDQGNDGWSTWDQTIARVLQSEKKLAAKVGLKSRVEEIDLMINYFNSLTQELKELEGKFKDLRRLLWVFEEIAASGQERYFFHWRQYEPVNSVIDSAIKYPDVYKNSYAAILEHLDCSGIDKT